MALGCLYFLFLPALGIARETVWAVVTISNNGERAPPDSGMLPSITPIGIGSMNSAGSFFRHRYIDPTDISSEAGPALTIPHLSQQFLNYQQVRAYAADSLVTTQSAMTFMQALYPSTNVTLESEMMARTVEWPNFPAIDTFKTSDINSIYYQGHVSCPVIDQEIENRSKDLKDKIASQSLYDMIASKYEFIKSSYNLNSRSARQIWEYLDYTSRNHLDKQIARESVERARYFANEEVRYLFSQKNSSTAIAARTLLSRISCAFLSNSNSKGTVDKLNAVFVSNSESITSLLTILDIVNATSALSGLPDFGSTLAFELFTKDSVETPALPPLGYYPREENLSVRLFFRNGTTATLEQLPIFDSEDSPSLASFLGFAGKEAISDPGDWCLKCLSKTSFCLPYLNSYSDLCINPSKLTHGYLIGAGSMAILAILIGLLVLCFLKRRKQKHELKRDLILTRRPDKMFGGFLKSNATGDFREVDGRRRISKPIPGARAFRTQFITRRQRNDDTSNIPLSERGASMGTVAGDEEGGYQDEADAIELQDRSGRQEAQINARRTSAISRPASAVTVQRLDRTEHEVETQANNETAQQSENPFFSIHDNEADQMDSQTNLTGYAPVESTMIKRRSIVKDKEV